MRTIVIVAVMLASGTAFAFHTPSVFEDSVAEGGGHRVYFTGSQRQKGYDCGACHVDAARTIRTAVEFSPAVAGAYEPGRTYAITVTLVGEHRGFGAASNQNSFLAEVVDDSGAPAGVMAAPDQDVARLIDDGFVVGGVSTGGGATTWSFAWTAPAAGAGPVAMYVAIVDGDGANSATELTDPGGDDWDTSRLRLCEGSSGCAERASQPVTKSKAIGCSAGGEPSLGILLVVVCVALARRRRALAFVILAGCFDPTGAEECPNRVCGNGATGDGGSVDGSTCAESWSCTTWEAPTGSNMATRTCTDKNQRGTTECKPDEGPTLLPALDLEMFKCDIQPIFQRDCSMMGCHGTNTERPFRVYARGRLRNNEIVNRTGSCIPATGTVNLDEAGTGTIMCEGWLPHTANEWKKNFDSARSFMLDVGNPDDSLMLRMPTVGGLPHIDIKLFTSTDPKYTKIRNWLGGAQRGSTCNTGRN